MKQTKDENNDPKRYENNTAATRQFDVKRYCPNRFKEIKRSFP